MNWRLVFASAVIILAAWLCYSMSQTVVPVHQIQESSGMIENWAVIGPFSSDSDRANHDFWDVNGDEAKLAASDVELYRRKSWLRCAFLASSAKIKSVKNKAEVDLRWIFKQRYDPISEPQTAYLCTNIEAHNPSTVFCLLASGGIDTVWLNGALVSSGGKEGGAQEFEKCVALSLRRGMNFLLVKLTRNRSSTWGLAARLECSAEEAARTSLLAQRLEFPILLKKAVIENRSLLFSPRAVPTELPFHATILDLDGNKLAERTISLNQRWGLPERLNPGLYQFNIQVLGDSFSQYFFLGDIAKFARALTNRIIGLDLHDDQYRIVGPLLRRIDILLSAIDDEGPDFVGERRLDYKLVSVCRSLEAAIRNVSCGRKVDAQFTGLVLRSFVSEIDGTEQHYRIFLPKKVDGRPLPLLVLTPTVTATSRPFIASAFVAAHTDAERFGRIAEHEGIATLWCGFRTQITGAPCEFAHVEEVLRDVSRNYTIDPNRIYLAGQCSGAAFATMLAVRTPDRFAAVALLNPVKTLTKRLTYEEMGLFGSDMGFQSWSSGAAPYKRFFSHSALPCYIMCDGGEPGHGEIDDVMDVMEEAAGLRSKPIFTYKGRLLGQHVNAWRELLHWLAKQARAAKDHIQPRVSHIEPLRMSDAFAAPFVVVVGTRGSGTDTSAIRGIADEFLREWRTAHFGECRVVDDTALTEDMRQNFNLVLIGNANTNHVWMHYEDKLPVKIRPSYVGIGSQKWFGTELSVQAIVANRDTGRKLVLIGAENLSKARFGTMRLSTNGWFSFAIWRSESGLLHLVSIDVRKEPIGFE